MDTQRNRDNTILPDVAADLPQVLGFSTESDTDLVSLPTARLAQGLTPEVLDGQVQPGTWILPGGRTVSEIAGTIIAVKKSRALWDRSGGTATVRCQSDDGVNGTGDPGGPCDQCELAKWHDSVPPECTLSYKYLLVLDDGGAPLVVSMSTKSASQTIGAVNLALRARGQVPVTLRSQLVVKGSRRYYVPTAEFRW